MENEGRIIVPQKGYNPPQSTPANSPELLDSTSVWYGPYPCEKCKATIIRRAEAEGGTTLDYPPTPIYPNVRWFQHDCKTSEEFRALAEEE